MIHQHQIITKQQSTSYLLKAGTKKNFIYSVPDEWATTKCYIVHFCNKKDWKLINMYICTYILAYHDIKSTIFDVVIFDKPSFSAIILTWLSLVGHLLVSLFLIWLSLIDHLLVSLFLMYLSLISHLLVSLFWLGYLW